MRNDWAGQQLPHPPGRRPLVGDVLGIDRERPLTSFMERGRGLGPIFEAVVFGQKFVFVAGAELAAEMCDEQRFAKALPPALTALREFAGQGLFTARTEEPLWSLAHELLLPAFTRSAMQGYHPIMLETIRELFDHWSALDGPVDVSRDMTKLTMETLSRAAFSRDFGSFRQAEPHPFVPAMIAALRTGQRKAALDTAPGGALVKAQLDRRNAGHQAYVDELVDGVIADRRASGDTSQRDLLGLMLNARHPETGEQLPDLNIRHQILTFLVAGHETTSGALSFALHHLAQSPTALAAAHAEVDAVLGPDPDVEPTFEQVPRLRYLRRVLDETLRLWPTAPAFGRSPRAETVLSTGHRMRPQDWAIVVLPMVHRDPAVWGDDADRFDPDRFRPELVRARPSHTYKPFGTGERACIGRQFALHEAVLVLARVLHRFEIAGEPDYRLRVSERLTLMPEGFGLHLTPRTPQVVPSDVRPDESIDQPGFQATSQQCPSRSAK